MSIFHDMVDDFVEILMDDDFLVFGESSQVVGEFRHGTV